MSEIEVKALEWHTTEDVTQNTTGCIHYKIEHFAGGAGYGVYVHGWVGLHAWSFTTLDEAKAAAQSDYEARIRSAIIERKAEPVGYVTAGEFAMLRHGASCVDLFRKRVDGFPCIPVYSTPPDVPVRVTDEMVAAYKAAYRQHTDACILGFIPSQTDGIIIEATRRGIAAALSASPSPVDSRELIERLVKALKPFAQAASVLRTVERTTGREFKDEDAFQSGLAWNNDGIVTTITYGHLRAARAALSASPSPVDSRDGLIEQLVKALEKIAEDTRRCDHDMGYDREMGPLGCSLGDRCVCMGIHMTARAALAAKEQQP